jgi:S-formylglutathione hydrolase FrmB
MLPRAAAFLCSICCMVLTAALCPGIPSLTIAKDRFEDSVVKDVVSQIDRQYRIIPGRSGRAIAGMLMGGYGAIKLALKYPELFSFAGSIGGVVAPEDLDPLKPQWGPKRVEVFGPRAIMQRDSNSVFWLLEALVRPSPVFYLACGTEDWNLDANRAFVLQLASRKLAYEYHETLGGHTWEYWDHALQPMLLAASRAIASNQADAPPPHVFSRLHQLIRGG